MYTEDDLFAPEVALLAILVIFVVVVWMAVS